MMEYRNRQIFELPHHCLQTPGQSVNQSVSQVASEPVSHLSKKNNHPLSPPGDRSLWPLRLLKINGFWLNLQKKSCHPAPLAPGGNFRPVLPKMGCQSLGGGGQVVRSWNLGQVEMIERASNMEPKKARPPNQRGVERWPRQDWLPPKTRIGLPSAGA